MPFDPVHWEVPEPHVLAVWWCLCGMRNEPGRPTCGRCGRPKFGANKAAMAAGGAG